MGVVRLTNSHALWISVCKRSGWKKNRRNPGLYPLSGWRFFQVMEGFTKFKNIKFVFGREWGILKKEWYSNFNYQFGGLRMFSLEKLQIPPKPFTFSQTIKNLLKFKNHEKPYLIKPYFGKSYFTQSPSK